MFLIIIGSQFVKEYPLYYQIKLPFEKVIHTLGNFPVDAMDPVTLLPVACSVKVD